MQNKFDDLFTFTYSNYFIYSNHYWKDNIKINR